MPDNEFGPQEPTREMVQMREELWELAERWNKSIDALHIVGLLAHSTGYLATLVPPESAGPEVLKDVIEQNIKLGNTDALRHGGETVN